MEATVISNILAMVGLGLMLGLGAAGAGVGFFITCSTAIGVIRKKPEAFGTVLVLGAVPSSQGLYAFVAFIMYYAAASSVTTVMGGAIVLGMGIAVGVACIVTCIYQAKICASGISAIGDGHNVLGNTLILAAFPEFFAILSLVGSILMLGFVK
jgi:V/A-type H+-transporting ATPase subunit K